MAPHYFPDPNETKEQTRQRLGIPVDAKVLFAFGHIRDNKNLDYAVRALKEIPGTHLLVAGARNATSQKPESHYKNLAESLGVADRCTWLIDYVSEQDAANLFTASDLILLTYSRTFRSASGVLNVAAWYRKPCIASSGEGSLQKVVKSYALGIWVEPDQPEAVTAGVREWISNPPIPKWEEYNRDNSWERNAQLVARAFGWNAGEHPTEKPQNNLPTPIPQTR
jgi:glycosyltransferase involved in cell wall biosynthesis